MNLETLTEFLGWVTLINIGMLTFATLFVVAFRDFTINMHSRMFHLDQQALSRAYFSYLGNYKIIIITFNLVPWLALKIMI